MTCIVGVECNGKVYMGCDSASSDGYLRFSTRLTKVFQRENLLIGYTSSFRMGQLLQYSLDIPEHSEEINDLEYMATKFVDAVRDCLKSGGFSRVENSTETGGEFLVGYRGKLYAIYDDYQVNSSIDGFMAVGSGSYYALGSLYCLDNDLPIEKRIQLALDAASHFSPSVCPPFYTREL